MSADVGDNPRGGREGAEDPDSSSARSGFTDARSCMSEVTTSSPGLPRRVPLAASPRRVPTTSSYAYLPSAIANRVHFFTPPHAHPSQSSLPWSAATFHAAYEYCASAVANRVHYARDVDGADEAQCASLAQCVQCWSDDGPCGGYAYLSSVVANCVHLGLGQYADAGCDFEAADVTKFAKELLASVRERNNAVLQALEEKIQAMAQQKFRLFSSQIRKRAEGANLRINEDATRIKHCADRIAANTHSINELTPASILGDEKGRVERISDQQIEMWKDSIIKRIATQVIQHPTFLEGFADGVVKNAEQPDAARGRQKLVEDEIAKSLRVAVPRAVRRGISTSLESLRPVLTAYANSLTPPASAVSSERHHDAGFRWKPKDAESSRHGADRWHWREKTALEAVRKMAQPLRDQIRRMRMEVALITAELEERQTGKVGGKVGATGTGLSAAEQHLRHLVDRSLPSVPHVTAPHAGFREACEYALELHHAGAVQIQGMSPVVWACITMADARNGERFLNFTTRIYEISPGVQQQLAEILLRGAGSLTEVHEIEAIVAWVYQILTYAHHYLSPLPPLIVRAPSFRQVITELLGWRQKYWQSRGPVGRRACELLLQALQLYS